MCTEHSCVVALGGWSALFYHWFTHRGREGARTTNSSNRHINRQYGQRGSLYSLGFDWWDCEFISLYATGYTASFFC